MRPRQEIAAGNGSWASGDDRFKTPTVTFADVGGLEESKKQIRDLVQANLNGKKFAEYGGHSADNGICGGTVAGAPRRLRLSGRSIADAGLSAGVAGIELRSCGGWRQNVDRL